MQQGKERWQEEWLGAGGKGKAPTSWLVSVYEMVASRRTLPPSMWLIVQISKPSLVPRNSRLCCRLSREVPGGGRWRHPQLWWGPQQPWSGLRRGLLGRRRLNPGAVPERMTEVWAKTHEPRLGYLGHQSEESLVSSAIPAASRGWWSSAKTKTHLLGRPEPWEAPGGRLGRCRRAGRTALSTGWRAGRAPAGWWGR